METRTLGRTELKVTRLGFGGARIGQVPSEQADALLNGLLDMGITLVDTAACYKDSEAVIGRCISARRDAFVLITKCGHITGSATGEPWSRRVISESIDRSLERLATDHLDLIQLHSCSAEVLKAGEAVEAIMRAREAGKTRYVGYSGDGEDALEAIRMGIFVTLQTSFNIVDQRALAEVLPAAVKAGMGIIAKRPIANGAFGRPASPYSYADTYWDRMRQFQVPEGAPEDPIELSLRFTLSHNEIDSAIVGASSTDHVRQNLRHVAAGPLPSAVIDGLHGQFQKVGGNWDQQT